MFSHQIPEFPEGEEYWMIVWVYGITLEESNYFFTVDLAEIRDPRVLSGPKPYSTNNYNAKRRTVTIGYKFLPVMEIGSVWHRKHLIFAPASQSHRDSLLSVSIKSPQQATSTSLYTLAQQIDNFGRSHPFGSLDNQSLASSLCHILKADTFTIRNGERIDMLILPPSELLRFYYCGSANFLKQILSNGIPDEQVYLHEATQYDSTTHELSIRMRGHLRDSDAHFVGRLAGSQIAYQVATGLGKYIQQNLINHQVSHLDTSFPFTDSTVLRVTGKWLKTLNGPKSWAFLVYTIISCTAKLPYNKLHYYRENDATKTDDPEKTVQAERGAVREAHLPNEGATISSNTTPDPDFATGNLDVLIAAENKFLQAPPAIRIPKEQQLVATIGKQPHWYVNLPSYTVSDGHGSSYEELSGGLSTEVENDTNDEDEGVSYSQFHLITIQLRALAIACSYINYYEIDGENGRGYIYTDYLDFPYPYISTKLEIKRWLPIQSPRDKNAVQNRRRRVVILQLVYGGNVFYLIECEARKSENFSRLLLKPNTPHHNVKLLLSKLLGRLAEHRGIWKTIWEEDEIFELDITKQAIHHGSTDTPAHVASRVVGYIKRML